MILLSVRNQIIFEKIVLLYCDVDTIVVNMFKYMEDIKDYLDMKFHVSIKICNFNPSLIPSYVLNEVNIQKIHELYSNINYRTIIELDNKKYKYVTANFIKLALKTLFKYLFIGKI